MDHKRRNNASTMVVLVSLLVLIFASQLVKGDSFQTCLEECGLGCLVEHDKVSCLGKCLEKCFPGKGSDSALAGAGAGAACLRDHDYCKLGCAMKKCFHTLSSVLENGGGIEVRSAVETLDSCVNECGLGECGHLLSADGGCAMSESNN